MIPSQTKFHQICAHISLFQLALQIDQASNLDKKSTVVIYKVFNIDTLTCMDNNPKWKEIMNFQKCYQLSKSLEKTKNWTNREIEIIATNQLGLKPRQGVLSSDLQTLHYNLGDMHNLTPKIRGDTTPQI
jgi:hypothetical protein